MASKVVFGKDALTSFLKNNLQYDTEKNFAYLVKKCSCNDYIFCLNILTESSPDIEYGMVKIVNNEEFNENKLDYVKKLENAFTIQDEKKDLYLVLEKKDLLLPRRNNLEDITTILKSLAEFQAKNLLNTKSGISYSEYKVKDISDALMSLVFFKAFDKDTMNDIISNIQKSVDDLYKNSPLVKSIVNVSANNIILIPSDKCVFLNSDHEVFISPVFDALVLIFALSDGNFRQNHLKKLLNQYFETFIDVVKKTDANVAEKFDFNVFESHLKILLPTVKLAGAEYLIQKDKSLEEQKSLNDLINNIGYCFKYPPISYEDCMETISTKLESTYFELDNYQLLPLDEKNGHMGEYFNLIFKINHSGTSKEFTMFLKLLNVSNEVLNFLTPPASLKEQFFFRTLVPLFKQYNLESLLDFAPNCYFDRLSDVVIQENVVQLGFKPLRPNVKFGYDDLKVIFLNSAKLHACSLILEDRLSKEKGTTVRLGDDYHKFFHDWIFESVDGVTKLPVHPDNSKVGIHELIESFADISKDISLEEFHTRVDGIFEIFIERLNYPAEQFRNVVCHGDMYSSNMLIKYNQNNKAENCFLIDYQCLRYAPITSDILMIAYFNTRKEVRDKYLEKLLKEYYDELKKIMSELGEDVNKFYTPEEFTKCVQYMRPISLIVAISYAQILGVPQEKREEVFFDEDKFNYYLLEHRREYTKYLLSFGEDYVSYLKELINDLYDVCVS